MKNKEIIQPIVALVIVIILVVTAVNLFGEKRGLTVTGSSEIEMAPDELEIFFEIKTNATTAQPAQEENAFIVDKAITAFKVAGVAEENIQTLNYRMSPRYYWDSNERKQIEDGYEVVHYIKIDVSDMLNAGNYIDLGIRSGVTRVSHIQLGLTPERENEAKGRAIELAAANAKAKAEGMASGLGMKLGKLISVSDSSHSYSPYMRTFAEAGATEEAKLAVADTVISPGELTIRGTVNVRYALK